MGGFSIARRQDSNPTDLNRQPRDEGLLRGVKARFSVFCCFLLHQAFFSRGSGPLLQQAGCDPHR